MRLLRQPGWNLSHFARATVDFKLNLSTLRWHRGCANYWERALMDDESGSW